MSGVAAGNQNTIYKIETGVKPGLLVGGTISTDEINQTRSYHGDLPMRRNDWVYASPAQEAYINRLRKQVQKYGTAKWPTINRQLLKSEASIEIDMLKAAILEGETHTNSETQK